MRHGFRVVTYEAELDNIAGWVLEHPMRETGGDLCGFWTNARSPCIQFVLGPGPRARHEITAFYQDGDYLRDALRKGREQHGLQQVGEWHSHHRLGLAEPSGGDARTVRGVFERYPIDEFLLCIANIRSSGSWVGGSRRRSVGLGAFMFRRGHPGWMRGTWVVLPGVSPIAEAFRSDATLQFPRQPARDWTVSRGSLEDSLEPPPPVPPGWYSIPTGGELLKQFDSRCRTVFTGCGISLDNGVLCYGLTFGNCSWELRFPSRFPGDRVELEDADKTLRHYLNCCRTDSLARAAEALFRDVSAIVGVVEPDLDVAEPAP